MIKGLSTFLTLLKKGVEFCGKHPFATGLFAILGIIGLIISLKGYNRDRQEAEATTNQVDSVARQIQNIDTKLEQYNTKESIFIPAIRDESYAVARALLIREGWIPQTNHWSHGSTVDIQSGNGPDLWEKGYQELDYCSGTGYALCRFEFNDPKGNLLVIITSGESYEGNIDNVKVFRVYLNPENEEGAYGDLLGTDRVSVEKFQKILEKVKEDNKNTKQNID